jgi:NAD(P)-dependent dehydrogenase (short-subunit alcohol dehydrogenase family)
MRMQGKTVIITGGNSGIGFASAKRMVEEGARVAITGRNENKLREAVKALGDMASSFRIDATDFSSLESSMRNIADTIGRVDAVFLNAGTGSLTPLGGTSEALFDEIVNTNLKSIFFSVQALLPVLNDGASVVFNGSIGNTTGAPGMGVYAATKAGLYAMAKCFATELKSRRIRFNVLSPGNIETPFWSHVAAETEIDFVKKFITQSIPMGRMGEAIEIAHTVLFLCSDESSYIQSQQLYVDGGVVGSPMGAPVYKFPGT